MTDKRQFKKILFITVFSIISLFILRPAYSEVASIVIDCGKESGIVSPLLFGNNIEWTWNGDGIWDQQADSFAPGITDLFMALNASIMRFPGGSLSDKYIWHYGIGNAGTRRNNLDYDNNQQKSNFGSDEFHRLLNLTSAEGLITVNVGTGSPDDAANWVEYCNGTESSQWGGIRAQNGFPKPFKIHYWELGNELYGAWESGNCTIDSYSEKVRQYIDAMKRKDGSIKIGAVVMPESDRLGANDTDDEWNRTLLETVGREIDFLSIHLYGPDTDKPGLTFFANGSRVINFESTMSGEHLFEITAKGTSLESIYPIMVCQIDNKSVHQIILESENWSKYYFSDQIEVGQHKLKISFTNDNYRPPEDRNLFIEKIIVKNPSESLQINLVDDSEIFKATMANSVYSDWLIKELKKLINEVIPEKSETLNIAVTEYNGLSGAQPGQPDLKSALLTADLIHVFLKNQLNMANYWSLIGNTTFGSIKDGQSLVKRPSYYVLSLLSSHQNNIFIETSSESPTFSTNFYGEMQIFNSVPFLSEFCTINQKGTKLILSVINKHYSEALQAEIFISSFKPDKSATVFTLNAQNVNSNNEANRDNIKPVVSLLDNVSPYFIYEFPPHSLTLIEFTSSNLLAPTNIRVLASD